MSKRNNWLIIGGLLVVLIIIGAIFYQEDSVKYPQEIPVSFQGHGYNLDQALVQYRAKLESVNQNIVIIGCIGDSVTEGYNSGNNDELAWPVRLREAMQAKYGGSDEGFVSVKDSDRWIRSGSGWSQKDYGTACRVDFSSTNGDKMMFTFNGTHFDLIYGQHPDGGTAAVTVDGNTQSALNCAGSLILGNAKSYGPFVNGNHTVIISVPTNRKNVYIEGAVVKSGNIAGIRVDRRACAGSEANYWNTYYTKKATFTNNPCDLYIIVVGGNDAGSGRTPAQVKADIEGLVQAAILHGSVILIPMWQPDPNNNQYYSRWPAYQSLYYELADQYNIGVIDLYSAAGKSYKPASTYGLIDADGVHATVAGQQFIADLVYMYINN